MIPLSIFAQKPIGEIAAERIRQLHAEVDSFKSQSIILRNTINSCTYDLKNAKKEIIKNEKQIQELKASLKINISALLTKDGELKLKDIEIQRFEIENKKLLDEIKQLKIDFDNLKSDKNKEVYSANEYKNNLNREIIEIGEDPHEYGIQISKASTLVKEKRKNSSFIGFVEVSPAVVKDLASTFIIKMRFSTVAGGSIFEDKFFIGLGLGYDKYVNFSTFPVFLSLRAKISSGDSNFINPGTLEFVYFTIDFGYSIYQKNSDRDLLGHGNFMFNGGLGATLYFTKNYGIHTSVNLKLQKLKDSLGSSDYFSLEPRLGFIVHL